MFHILSHTDGDGGESVFVDGLAAARKLFQEDSTAYRILGDISVHWHASGNEDVSIQPQHSFPVFEHDPVHGHLFRIRWNNADRAGIAADFCEMPYWYEAAE